MNEREELIAQVEEAIHKRRGRHRRPRGEDSSAWTLLKYLQRAEREVNPSELCSVMKVTTPRITTILNDLEAKGFITRQISLEDRRRICVALTDKGREKLEAGKKRQHEKISKILDMVGEDDVRAFLRYIAAEEEVDREMEAHHEHHEM